MTRESYHHGTLKNDLIHNGLILLNRDGYEKFSLRKLAQICNVSQSAPYNHFKNKDELISAIIQETINSFSASLKIALKSYPDNPAIQLLEMGKQFVSFMVENPEYLKFLFLNNEKPRVIIHKSSFLVNKKQPFCIFETCATNYLDYIGAKKEGRIYVILAMWSLVHGIAVLIVNNNVKFEENYLDYVTKMITSLLIFNKEEN